MSDLVCIKPCDWAKFQHYKARRPPWIKLHRSLLDNFKWHSLTLAGKALAPMLWLLASEHEEGIIMGDIVEIAFRLRIDRGELDAALEALKTKGFFEEVEVMLATRVRLAPESCSESEGETETEIRGRRTRGASAKGALARAEGEEGPKLPPRRTDEGWQNILDGYRPWESVRAWSGRYGPPPDSAGGNSIIPPHLLRAWQQKCAAEYGKLP